MNYQTRKLNKEHHIPEHTWWAHIGYEHVTVSLHDKHDDPIITKTQRYAGLTDGYKSPDLLIEQLTHQITTQLQQESSDDQ